MYMYVVLYFRKKKQRLPKNLNEKYVIKYFCLIFHKCVYPIVLSVFIK